MSISFMAVEYRRTERNGTIHDILGIFEGNELKRTVKVQSANDFLQYVSTKNPKTIRGSLGIITRFNNLQQNKNELNG